MKMRLFALLPMSLFACTNPSSDVTFHKDIAPLLNSQCVACHQEGGMAPMPLLTYAQVQPMAELIATSIEARIMPPTIINASGECGDFTNAPYLTDEQIAMVRAWVDGGAVEGQAPAEALAPAAPDVLAEPDIIVEMPEPYTPKPSTEHPTDDYRCFILDPQITTDRYLTAMQIVPGDRAEVHHMLLFALHSQDAEDAAYALEAEDSDPGFACFSVPNADDTTLVTGWAPGSDVVNYPDGTGLKLTGNRKIVMQIHYNLLAGARPDLTSLHLRTAESVAAEALLAPIADTGMVLPAGQASTTFQIRQSLLQIPDLLLHGVFPHMHLLGKSMRFEVSHVGAEDESFCLADVPAYDFHWQNTFFYQEPVLIVAGDIVDLKCTYDTSSRTSDVPWGEGTTDEMCLVFTYVTKAEGGPLPEF